MLIVHKSDDRGYSDYGWLQSHHSFSFAGYYDPKYMGVSVLRVINDDVVAPSGGFPTHGHRDMEIISYITSGSIRHKDTSGHETVLSKGELQVMTAGTGIQHSEFNDSNVEPLHFLQIWILPNKKGLKPRYENRPALDEHGVNLVASGKEEDNVLFINQDVSIFLIRLSASEIKTIQVEPSRVAYLHIIKGKTTLDGHELGKGMQEL